MYLGVFVTYNSISTTEEIENGILSIPVMLKVPGTGQSPCGSQSLRTQREVEVSYTFFDGDAKSKIEKKFFFKK